MRNRRSGLDLLLVPPLTVFEHSVIAEMDMMIETIKSLRKKDPHNDQLAELEEEAAALRDRILDGGIEPSLGKTGG